MDRWELLIIEGFLCCWSKSRFGGEISAFVLTFLFKYPKVIGFEQSVKNVGLEKSLFLLCLLILSILTINIDKIHLSKNVERKWLTKREKSDINKQINSKIQAVSAIISQKTK